MNYLSVENLSKNYGEKTLFENLNFGLSRGDKFALIANNGTGKTTLLKIIAGKDTPDAGGVAFKNGVRIGFLEQEPQFNESQSINELLIFLEDLATSSFSLSSTANTAVAFSALCSPGIPSITLSPSEGPCHANMKRL